jgi:preprotein translocase subunit Sec61beta
MSATQTRKATAAIFETVAEPFDAGTIRGKTEAKPAWKVALDCLLIVWAVISVAVVVLVIALFVPGHLGLGDLLQALGNLSPPDLPFFTT